MVTPPAPPPQAAPWPGGASVARGCGSTLPRHPDRCSATPPANPTPREERRWPHASAAPAAWISPRPGRQEPPPRRGRAPVARLSVLSQAAPRSVQRGAARRRRRLCRRRWLPRRQRRGGGVGIARARARVLYPLCNPNLSSLHNINNVLIIIIQGNQATDHVAGSWGRRDHLNPTPHYLNPAG